MSREQQSAARRTRTLAAAVGAAFTGIAFAAVPAAAGGVGPCSTNAQAGLQSCKAELQEEFWEAIGNCANEPDPFERAECVEEAGDTSEAAEECLAVYEARNDLCDEIGQDAYDPEFEAEDFDSDFTALTNPNPYFPLGIGNTWEYATAEESISIEVLDATKLIDGVTCITSRDVAAEEGVVVESTDDWYGQGIDGTVHYCGEISRNFELFEGDDPEEPELVDVDGSWKADRDDAEPGILMPASPEPGAPYRQEFAFGEAEDVGQVLSNAYSFGNGEGLDEGVPEALADYFCSAGDCVVTKDTTPLEPDALEHKYYANGVGLFLEVSLPDGDFVPLVACNFHALCDGIPDVSEE